MANEEQATASSPPDGTAHHAPQASRLRDVNEQLMLSALAAQEAAEESAARYRDLVEGVDAIVWEANADPWAYTFVSPRAQAILGHPVERWFTEPNLWMDLIHPDDRPQAVTMWKVAASGKKDFRLDYRVIAADGRIVWLAMIARVRQPEQGPAQFRGLLLDIGDSIRAKTLQSLVTHQTAELVSRQAQLGALATALNLAEHRERTKLATELHDHLAQLLVLGLLNLGQAMRAHGVVRGGGDFIEQAEDVLTKSLAYTRTLVAELSPSVLREFGLAAALQWLAGQMQRYHLTVEIEPHEAPEMAIPEDQAVLLFQSVRELLFNIVKHAQTSQASVSMRCPPGVVHLVVRDQGCGFDGHQTAESSKFGLFSIRERMKVLGGWFDVKSAPGQGTTATLILPWPHTQRYGR